MFSTAAGYDTVMVRLFEDGKEVSIRQWQKIAIARSFYSDANFLIFDEATSAMDAVAEKVLLDSFRSILGKRAAVMISHRHSAINIQIISMFYQAVKSYRKVPTVSCWLWKEIMQVGFIQVV